MGKDYTEFCLNCNQTVAPTPRYSLGSVILVAILLIIFLPLFLTGLFFSDFNVTNYSTSVGFTIILIILLPIIRYARRTCPICKTSNYRPK